ncbi:MAG: metallophosphoesterase [Desulfobacterales bacterium]|nr:metallophosphoesterase [Desulfobacterales bacterium]MDD4072648.1 metallophosphoesterase [Desulfobacterales bacterium]MDD4391595.1 metallophosphoesterase [Desulfobacterales bacterium]
MSLFLAVFLSIYSAMHALFFFRVRPLIPASGYWRFPFTVFLIFMILAPVLSRMFERFGFNLTGRAVGIIGYYWMGFIFLAFTGIILTMAYDLLAWAVSAVTPIGLPLSSGKPAVLGLIVLVVMLCGYGVFEARELKIETIRIETKKFPPNVDRFRIVQISDIHLGLMTQSKRLNAITDAVKSTRPDLIVCTGDLVDGRLDHINGLSDLLRELDAPYGKYAVTGNHEFYAGLARSERFLKKSGFILLRDRAISTDPGLNIVGVDDHSIAGSISEDKLLDSVYGNGQFTLLLKHRPLVSPGSEGRFDLQLSGHTHKGQIFPFNYLVALLFPMIGGHYELANGAHLYTSRGTGTWGPPMRILAPPEITVVELVRGS